MRAITRRWGWFGSGGGVALCGTALSGTVLCASGALAHDERGVLVSWGDSPNGTGVFEGVAGDLFFSGRNVDGVFLVQVRGALCRPAE